MIIRNALAMTPAGFDGNLAVRLCGDVISDTGYDLSGAEGEKEIDLEGDYLLPGFVDVHIHGFRGCDTMRSETDIRKMSRELAGIGVGAFCPTTMSASDEETGRAIRNVCAVMQKPEKGGSRILGVHMEAPFLSEERAGAQQKEFFCDPDEEKLKGLAENLSAVRLITIAPERNGSERFTRSVTAAGIHVSIGHTNADAETVHQAADWGADHITHTFNAQTPIHHRRPGVPGAALTDRRFYCEMICDGKHLHDDIVRMIIRCKGAERAIAITDAMEAAGMPEGRYTLGGEQVFVSNKTARLQDGTLAGSVLTMHEALSRLIHVYGIEPYSACMMCTAAPAESIGEKKAGYITAGSPAILTRWTREWQMKSVITSDGEICHYPC
jgi:N-acetylglucosamine-6-phosphate deacetylase